MKRIKMPLNFRMQNFIFLPGGEIFWTSASKTILQKIKRFLNKDDSHFCNTSRGFTLPFHGQNIRYNGKHLVSDRASVSIRYSLETGEWLKKVDSSELPNQDRIRALCPDKYLQGISYTNNYDLAVFGKPDTNNIKIYSLLDSCLYRELNYKTYKKWYWKNWEAEGLQRNLNGQLEVGISVKTIFGAILNYRELL